MEIQLDKPIRLVATDVDGTLVQSDKTVSPAAVAAIHRAIESGVKVAIASGRSYSEMFEIWEKVPEVRYFICTNGAAIIDKKEDKCLYHEQFDKAMALDLVRQLMAYGVYVEAYMDHEVVGMELPEDKIPYFFNDHVRPLILKSRRFVPDLLETLESYPLGPEKIQIFFGDRAMEERLIADFKDASDFDVLRSSEGNLEFVMTHNTKGTAVKALAEHWGFSSDEVMTIGDSHNDISMLSYAGVSVAMANSDAVVRSKAKYLTDSNDEDGFAKALNAVLDASERLNA